MSKPYFGLRENVLLPCYQEYDAIYYLHVPRLYIDMFVTISLKSLCSKVVETFTDHLCLLRFLTNSRQTKETSDKKTSV